MKSFETLIICSPRRNTDPECITLHHLFHACALTLGLCCSLLHQSPPSVLTQSVWLGNAEPERWWQWRPSCRASQQMITGQMFSNAFFLSFSDCEKLNVMMKGINRESCDRQGLRVSTYREAAAGCKSSRCVSTADEGEGRKLNPTWHCEPLTSVCGRKQLFYLHYWVWSTVASRDFSSYKLKPAS